MSRYLIPIDDGEEIQHLGRTLECTLCGLRGKRCHLTLHFKAKHNEVIDLASVHGTRKQTNKNATSKNVSSNQQSSSALGPPQPGRGGPAEMCWQQAAQAAAAAAAAHMTSADAKLPVGTPSSAVGVPVTPTQSQPPNGGHLSASAASMNDSRRMLTSPPPTATATSSVNDETIVQGTSQVILTVRFIFQKIRFISNISNIVVISKKSLGLLELLLELL